MRLRIEALLGVSARNLWVGTFHGIAHRILRRHARETGLPETFQILDSDDQYRLIRRIMKGLELDEAHWPPRQVQWYINAQKEEGQRPRPSHRYESRDVHERQMQEIYLAYQEQCERIGVVDFSELILRTYEFFRNSEEILKQYREKFQHVLVDEFQDTNRIQYALLNLLTSSKQNLFVVGDDDQSIYSWRGARIENLHLYQKDYPGHKLIRLEQNYRSTGHILNAANALISNNNGRLGKNLWTDGIEGEQISLYSAYNEQEEAHYVIDRIQQWVKDENSLDEVAILYRSNAQSRQFEEKLVANNIPYRVYGGLRFFERAEVKDAIAYVRLLINRNDDTSFERIINTPVRGIGLRTVDTIRQIARSEGCSLWQASHLICSDRALPSRSINPLQSFMLFMDELNKVTDGIELSDQVRIVIEKSGLKDHYKKEKGEQAESRLENLDELVNAVRQFQNEPSLDDNLPRLEQFLALAALESGDGQVSANQEEVQLMSLHSAKGLEFNLVFMVGMEEGLFPSLHSIEEPGRLEEERRLCYVGMTRARKKLTFIHAETRRLYGRETYPRPSRFLREIPDQYFQEVRMRGGITLTKGPVLSFAEQNNSDQSLRLGQRVRHAKFGEGVILQSEGEGSQARVQINFQGDGIKWLMLGYAKLEVL